MGQRDRELFFGVEVVRCRELSYGLLIPDLFMKRVKDGGLWSIFCPAECPGLDKCWGDEFDRLYVKQVFCLLDALFVNHVRCFCFVGTVCVRCLFDQLSETV